MPCQASTQWDALCHVFPDDKMYNGFDASLVDVKGAKKLGIEHVRDHMVGRCVLLDVARFKGVNSLDDGYAVTTEDLNRCAQAQKVEVRRGDFVIVRTGHQERCLAKGDWSGYAGGYAPGFGFETCHWLREKDVAAICSDRWGAKFALTKRKMPISPGIGSCRRALVTGAGRGIGEAAAVALATAGAHVTIAARSRTELETLCQRLRAQSCTVDVVVLDVLDVESSCHQIGEAEAFEILVNNAGTNRPKP
jgi:kynurenine formamidase